MPARSTTSRSCSTATNIAPQVTWGTNPGPGRAGHRPRAASPASSAIPTSRRRPPARSTTWASPAAKPICDLKLDRVFIGSCTNARIEDLRAAAAVVNGHKVAGHVNAMVVPGSGLVKQQAEKEGLDRIFKEAGFEWREAGCSMCLAMNPDKLAPGRALRLDLEPQLRRPPRPRRPHAPGLARDGRGGGVRGPFCGYPRVELTPTPIRIESIMKPFTKHTGRVVAMDRANVDTDQIIPKQFLKRIERTGFGEFLFWDWARDEDGSINPGLRAEPAGSARARACSSRGATSAAARAASMRRGRSKIGASA